MVFCGGCGDFFDWDIVNVFLDVVVVYYCGGWVDWDGMDGGLVWLVLLDVSVFVGCFVGCDLLILQLDG